MKMTLHPINDKVLQLARNGEACTCPFKTMIPVPGNIQGSVAIQAQPCTTQCPLMKIYVNETDAMGNKKEHPTYGNIILTCGMDPDPFTAEIIEKEEKSKLKLL